MSKINKITISNFKFFSKKETIELNGKHLPLYGENGSGKSSVYWGLYTLLEASMKSPADVHKYFESLQTSDESLVNIYAPEMSDLRTRQEHSDSYITIETNNGGFAYELSLLSNNVCGNADAQEARKATDFINYQSIFKFQEFRNSEKPDLYEVFAYSILPYVNFDEFDIKGRSLSNAGDMWQTYNEGPGTMRTKKGEVIQVRKSSVSYTQFTRFEAFFNSKMRDLIDFINNNSQDIIKKLGYDIRFHLNYSDSSHKRKEKEFIPHPFKVELVITEYNGKPVNIEKPNVFLNEAKMSALAIAIRLTVLNRRFVNDDNILKVLVLDDLMISLDMSNRDRLLDLLLTDYKDKYQLLFFTHDRVFFDCVMNHLPEDEQNNNWKFLELYETEDGEKKIPSIVSYQSPLSKAYAYFKGKDRPIDYNACGNNQRQALEELFKKQIHAYSLREDNGELVQTNGLMIAGCIAKAKAMYSKIGFKTDILDELEIHRKQSLNPTSHHNPQSNFYKSEIERTFEIINILEDCKIESLVPHNNIITLNVECDDGTICSYKVEILDDILAYKAPNKDYFVNLADKREYDVKEYNGNAISNRTKGLTLQEFYSETLDGIKNYLHKKPIEKEDVLSLFMYEGDTLHDILDKWNNRI